MLNAADCYRPFGHLRCAEVRPQGCHAHRCRCQADSGAGGQLIQAAAGCHGRNPLPQQAAAWRDGVPYAEPAGRAGRGSLGGLPELG
jgi:hypothetical protein